jgi:hypothetical protein
MSVVLDYHGNPRPQRTGPAIAPVVTGRCWSCGGTGWHELGLHELVRVLRWDRAGLAGGRIVRMLHVMNAGLWLANAVVWALYAGVVFMAGASLAAAGLSVYLWWLES